MKATVRPSQSGMLKRALFGALARKSMTSDSQQEAAEVIAATARQLRAAYRTGCPHKKQVWVQDKDGTLRAEIVSENHKHNCRSSATLGGSGSRDPWKGVKKYGGNLKATLSSFQTHRTVVTLADPGQCISRLRDSRRCSRKAVIGDYICTQHGGVPRPERARKTKTLVALRPEEMPVLACDL